MGAPPECSKGELAVCGGCGSCERRRGPLAMPRKPCLCARKAGPVSGGHRLLALRLPHSLARLQEALKCKNFNCEGIRTPAGRAQWISSPSPWPLGHTVSGVLGKETESWWLLVRKNNVAAGQTLVKSTGRSCVAWGHRRRGHHPSTGTRCLCRETCSEALALQRCLVGSDSEGIRTPAGRAQWISSPSP